MSQVGPPLLPGATPSSDAGPRRSAGVGFALGTAKRFLPSPPPPGEAGRRSPAFVSPRCRWVIRRPVGSLGACCGGRFSFVFEVSKMRMVYFNAPSVAASLVSGWSLEAAGDNGTPCPGGCATCAWQS